MNTSQFAKMAALPRAPSGRDIWFALDETRPLACFAGIWTNWTSVWKVKEGGTAYDIYAFLTTEPNAEVGAIHPKAMPVILTRPEEVETWMTAPPDDALIARRGRRTGRRSRLILRGHLRAAPFRVL
jgi:putative SOS response-associated peptidase YedK